MMFGWDQDDDEALREARDGPRHKGFWLICICLIPPVAGVVFFIVRAVLA